MKQLCPLTLNIDCKLESLRLENSFCVLSKHYKTQIYQMSFRLLRPPVLRIVLKKHIK